MAKNPNLKAANQVTEFTPEQVLELKKCAKDPVYFATQYCQIQHPTKGAVPASLYPYQKRMLKAFLANKNVIIRSARQTGKCVTHNTTVECIHSHQINTIKRSVLFLLANEIYQSVFGQYKKPFRFDHSLTKTSVLTKIKQKIVKWCLSPRLVKIESLHTQPISCAISDPATNELKFTEQTLINGTIFTKTPDGYSPVKRSLKTIPYQRWDISTKNHKLSGADCHLVINDRNKEICLCDLSFGDVVQTVNGKEQIVRIDTTGRLESMYDLELDDDKHVYYTNGILSHNSTVTAIYLLWYAIFQFEKTILIASNKNDNAMEMIFRIKFIYERLPHWLKPGLAADGYNKHYLGFDNGSRITSAATSESAGRGLSISLLFCLGGDTNVTLKDKETGQIFTISLEQAFKLLGSDESNADLVHIIE